MKFYISPSFSVNTPICRPIFPQKKNFRKQSGGIRTAMIPDFSGRKSSMLPPFFPNSVKWETFRYSVGKETVASVGKKISIHRIQIMSFVTKR